MYKLALLALTLTACGGSTTTTPDRAGDAESPHYVAMVDAHPLADAGPEDASADAPIEADGGGLLCCQTDQNLLVCTGGYVDSGPASWTCVDDAGTEQAPCTQTGIFVCYPGGICQGAFGTGTIIVCGH